MDDGTRPVHLTIDEARLILAAIEESNDPDRAAVEQLEDKILAAFPEAAYQ